jgi:hypothetical protein
MARLYTRLYIDKHSAHNTALSARYVALLCDAARADAGCRVELALDRRGELGGWQFEYRVGRKLFSPFIGVDPERSKEAGTYRGLAARGYQRAIDDGLWLHASAGAAAFKRHRGCQSGIDYHALYIDHLPRRRRAFYRALIALYSGKLAHGLVAQHGEGSDD